MIMCCQSISLFSLQLAHFLGLLIGTDHPTLCNLSLSQPASVFFQFLIDHQWLYFRRIENIGHIQQAVFDIAPKSGKQIIAASKENVIAGLSLSTGKISKITDFYLVLR